MIEIGLEAWGTLLAILCVGLAGSWFESQATDDAPLVHVGTLLFILWGFLLLLGEVCRRLLPRPGALALALALALAQALALALTPEH
jgi:hypothetical protein